MTKQDDTEKTEREGTDAVSLERVVPGRFSLFSKMILCVIIIFVADFIFYDAPLGWLTGGFLLLLGGIIRSVHGGWPVDTSGWVVMGWFVCISLGLVLSVTPMSVFLGMVSLLALYSVRRFSRMGHVFSYLGTMLLDLVQILFSPLLDSFRVMTVARREESGACGLIKRGVHWVIEWVVPAGLFFVFLVLFSLANPIFSSVFHPLRVLFWIMVGVLVWGLLRIPRSVFGFTITSFRTSLLSETIPRMSPGAIRRSLLVFNLLFLIQNGLDLMYLWGGRALPEGMTYAEYAHRGSYPLVVTALLAALFVLICFRAGEKPARMKWARRMVYLWIVQNIVLLGSAAWRLWIYVDFYGLSRWRVATALWMMLVATGLIYILLRILGGYTNRWLMNVNALTAIVLLTACTYVNVDRFIAEYNVTHCKEVSGEGASIDVRYLGTLGSDAVPALQRLRPHVKDVRKRKRILTFERKYTKHLVRKLQDWRGFTYRRKELLEVIIDPPLET